MPFGCSWLLALAARVGRLIERCSRGLIRSAKVDFFDYWYPDSSVEWPDGMRRELPAEGAGYEADVFPDDEQEFDYWGPDHELVAEGAGNEADVFPNNEQEFDFWGSEHELTAEGAGNEADVFPDNEQEFDYWGPE